MIVGCILYCLLDYLILRIDSFHTKAFRSQSSGTRLRPTRDPLSENYIEKYLSLRHMRSEPRQFSGFRTLFARSGLLVRNSFVGGSTLPFTEA
jgi:hypothetical protein